MPVEEFRRSVKALRTNAVDTIQQLIRMAESAGLVFNSGPSTSALGTIPGLSASSALPTTDAVIALGEAALAVAAASGSSDASAALSPREHFARSEWAVRRDTVMAMDANR